MITVVQSPSEVSPAFNDHIFLVESTNYASADFKFIAVIKDNGTEIAKLKAPILNGSTDQGVFNVQRIIESYVGYDFDLNLASFDNNNSTFEYEIEFGEEGAGVEHLNITSVTRWAWNAAMTRRNFAQYASGDWGIQGTTQYEAQFLTTQRRRRMRNEQVDWLYYLVKPSPIAFWVEYTVYRSYDAAGNLLKTVNMQYGTLSPSGEWVVDKVPSGQNLLDADSGSVLSGSLPVVDPVAAYYTVTLYDNNDQPRTEAYRIDVIPDCSRHTPITLSYLNPMGGFDSLQFDLVSRTFYDTERKQMKQQRYELGTDTYTYNINKHALVNYDNIETKRVQLNSDWLNDQESNAVHEMIASPTVFMIVDNEYFPVTITNTTWEEKSIGVDSLFNAQIEIKFDSERLQRG